MVLLWTNDPLIKRGAEYRVGGRLRPAVSPSHSTATGTKRGLWVTVWAASVALDARVGGNSEGIRDKAHSGPSAVPLDANDASWLRRGPGSVLNSSRSGTFSGGVPQRGSLLAHRQAMTAHPPESESQGTSRGRGGGCSAPVDHPSVEPHKRDFSPCSGKSHERTGRRGAGGILG